jgi:chorismate lyase/3-hydroxybenzoate synthase
MAHVPIETQPLPEIIECWQSDEIVGSGSVSAGTACNIRFTTSRSHLFAALEINEFAYGGLRAAARAGYEQLLAFQANSKWPAILRIWNYLDAINAVENGIERYREFCIGRLEGMGDGFESFPAASAIGRRDGNRMLQLIWIAAKTPGIAVENPRQISAYRYPERYGPTPPSFSRAVQHDNALIISGTASIVGHETLHSGDAIAQLEEANRNLHATASASSVVGGSLRAIKGYVRHPSAIEPLMTMTKNAPDAAPAALLADICRSDLLIELEGFYAPPATPSP